jgi:hypothetical protein
MTILGNIHICMSRIKGNKEISIILLPFVMDIQISTSKIMHKIWGNMLVYIELKNSIILIQEMKAY